MRIAINASGILSSAALLLATSCGLIPGNNLQINYTQGSSFDPNNPSGGAPGTLQVLDPVMNQKVLTLLQNKCVMCHNPGNPGGRFSDTTSADAIVGAGIVIPGDASNSPIVIRTQSGSMPLGGSLTDAEKQLLKDWASTGLALSSPAASNQPPSGVTIPGGQPPVTQPPVTQPPVMQPPVTPSPTPTVVAPPPPAQPSALAKAAFGVLKNNCSSCHNAGNAPHGIGNLLDFNLSISSGWTVPGNPGASPVWQQISAQNMPPSGPLTASDQTIIKNWIQNDLKAGNPQPQ